MAWNSGVYRPVAVRPALMLALTLVLIALRAGAASNPVQSLQVVTSNGPTNSGSVPILYGVGGVPGTPTLSVLGQSQTAPFNFASFVSLAYVSSNTVPNSYDVVAADNRGSYGIIWRLLGGLTTSGNVQQVWPACDGCNGPQQVLKVAIDGDGTLFVLSSDHQSYSDGRTTELWAFPKVVVSNSGFAAQPILVDAYVAGVGPNGSRDYSKNNIRAGEPPQYPAPGFSSSQSIVLRSGNNSQPGSPDPNITFYTNYSNNQPNYPGDGPIGDGPLGQFTSAAFAAAAGGAHAQVVSPCNCWLSGLSADPLAQWIAVDASSSPLSALYAYPFNVPSQVTAASMTLNFAVDNNLGESAGITGQGALGSSNNVPGLYLNGTALPNTSGLPPTNDGSAFTSQWTYASGDISALLKTGTNTLYLYQYDWGGIAGTIFSATINLTQATQNYDLIIAPAGVASPIGAGDVLVMFGDPGTNNAVVADYNAASLRVFIQTGVSQCNNVATCTGVNPLTVLNSDDLGFAAREAARSLAVWPQDSHVMVMTTTDVQSQTTFPIYKFTWTGSSNAYSVAADAKFASNIAASCTLTSGEFSIPCEPTTLRTGVQSGTAYAFVTAPAQVGLASNLISSPSQLLELTQVNAALNVTASAQQSNGALTGLAVQAGAVPGSAGTGTASGCLSGCNITGGANQTITGTTAAINAVNALTGTAATITETVCKVLKDPRKICGGTDKTNPQYSATELPVKSVCPDSMYNPSFGNSKIPDYICGNYADGLGYGFGTGFALIRSIAEGVDAIPGLFIKNDVNPEFFFGSPQPACPMGTSSKFVPDVFAWGTWTGSAVEGRLPPPEGLDLTELTWGCGGGTGHSSGNSVIMVGGRLDLSHATKELGPNPTVNSFLKFAYFKYVNLGLDVAGGNIAAAQKLRLLTIIGRSALFLAKGGAYYQDCAANKLWSADRYVSDNSSSFFGAPGLDPNPYGRSRARIANLTYVVFSEIEGQPPPVTWPLPSAPGSLCPASVYLDSDGY
jgi:hypothetical protein